jgi:hypothetical protein
MTASRRSGEALRNALEARKWAHMLYWVRLPYATFGLVVAAGRIERAPPIARWAIGKDADKVLAYYRRKGATIKLVSPGT